MPEWKTKCRCGRPLEFSAYDLATGRPQQDCDYWCSDGDPETGPHDQGVVLDNGLDRAIAKQAETNDCHQCGAPMLGRKCLRCGWIAPRRSEVVLTGTDITTTSTAPIVVNPSSVISRGTNQSVAAGTTLTIPGVVVGTTGSSLLMTVMFDINVATTCTATWGAAPMTNLINGMGTTNATTVQFILANATAGTATITITFDASTTRKAAAVVEITKLIASPLDKKTAAIGTSTTPDSSPVTTIQASEVLYGAVCTEGPVSDAAGTWTNGFTAGQRVGNAAGAAPRLTVSDGYFLATSIASYSAGKTGITSRDWVSHIVTLKTI